MRLAEIGGAVEVTAEAFAEWLALHGGAMVVIALAAVFTLRLLQHAIPAAITRAIVRESTPHTALDLHKRADTVTDVLLGTARVIILLVAVILVVDELGVNVVPVIAGLGIGGIAIGLGAQSLVKDAINGILILTENQYGKGDMITVAGVQGWVEEVNLRRTVLRDQDGVLHSVPNGEIKVASNLTRGFSGVNLVVPLAAGTDVEHAVTLIDQIGADLAADETLGAKVVEPPRAARIEAASAASVDLRVIGRVTPGAQWEVTSALRRRIMRAFDADGIRFGPLPAPPPPPAPPGAPAPPPR